MKPCISDRAVSAPAWKKDIRVHEPTSKEEKEIKLHQDRGRVQFSTEALQHRHIMKTPRASREKHAKNEIV
jgi:hypothetical protein